MSGLFKYPRTPHLPWSPGATNDDKVIKNLNGFVGKMIWVSEKMDGENTTLTRNLTHARSLDSKNHPSRNWLKQFWGSFSYKIPEGYRICGENLYARHSIEYDDLESYFYGFSVWDERNVALDMLQTQHWLESLGIARPTTLYAGVFDLGKIKQLCRELDPVKQEGLVIRVCNEIPYEEFESSVAKYVRKNHVQTDEHWMTQEIIPNKLKAKT